MRHIPFPTYDLLTPMKASPDRVDAIIRRMQDYLQRNSNPRIYASRGKKFRLTQVKIEQHDIKLIIIEDCRLYVH